MTNDAEFVLAELNRFRRASPIGRLFLAVLSAVQLFLAIPWLFGSSPLFGAETADMHLTRDGALADSTRILCPAARFRADDHADSVCLHRLLRQQRDVGF